MNNSSLPILTLGLDLGDRRHPFCLIDAEAGILEEASVPNSSEALPPFPHASPRPGLSSKPTPSYSELPSDCLRFTFPQERRSRITAVHRSHEHPMR